MTPEFIKERAAAKFLSMDLNEFRTLVAQDALPGPRRFDRWHVDELRAAMTGEGFRPDGEFQWGKK